ncbi:hypothetical protein Y046_6154 [Burkholderia pseudomallei MSHR2990]|nr:hypothetical protein Y046_6154 [Burkholderia pseudomallei MSHR2990]
MCGLRSSRAGSTWLILGSTVRVRIASISGWHAEPESASRVARHATISADDGGLSIWSHILHYPLAQADTHNSQ